MSNSRDFSSNSWENKRQVVAIWDAGKKSEMAHLILFLCGEGAGTYMTIYLMLKK